MKQETARRSIVPYLLKYADVMLQCCIVSAVRYNQVEQLMRLWSLHPKYLDARGLVAVWREALLAQAVLRGKTRGYRNHPQLQRFKNTANPAASIGCYLHHVYQEAKRRGYSFNQSRITAADISVSIPCTKGQMQYEWGHLLKKLAQRDEVRYEQYKYVKIPDPHPMFSIIKGPVEQWERVPESIK